MFAKIYICFQKTNKDEREFYKERAKIFKEKSDQAKSNKKYIELKEKFNEMIRAN